MNPVRFARVNKHRLHGLTHRNTYHMKKNLERQVDAIRLGWTLKGDS